MVLALACDFRLITSGKGMLCMNEASSLSSLKTSLMIGAVRLAFAELIQLDTETSNPAPAPPARHTAGEALDTSGIAASGIG